MCPTCIAKRRQQQPYLSDAYLPANLKLPSRRVQVNVARAEASDREPSPERYEASSDRPSTLHSQPSLERRDSHCTDTTYEEYGAVEHYEPLSQDQLQSEQLFEQYAAFLDPFTTAEAAASLDGTYSYPFYYEGTLDPLDGTLPEPPAPYATYDNVPSTTVLPDHDAEVYGDENSAADLYRQHYGVEEAQQGAAVSYEEYKAWETPAPAAGDEEAEPSTAYESAYQQYEPCEPTPALAQPEYLDWNDHYLGDASTVVSNPSSSSFVPSVVPTVVIPPSTSSGTLSSRRAKPPPLDLGKSSNLYPSSLDPTLRRAATTGVPQLLSPSYQPSAPLSAPLQLQRGAYNYGAYRELQLSPGLASACSTNSTIFSSAGSLPLTPGTSVDSLDPNSAKSLCSATAESFGSDWTRSMDGSNSQLDEAIRLLLDSTRIDLPEGISAVSTSAGEAYAAESEQMSYVDLLGFDPAAAMDSNGSSSRPPPLQLDDFYATVTSAVAAVASQQQQQQQPMDEDFSPMFLQHFQQRQDSPAPVPASAPRPPPPSRRPSDRPRSRHVSTTLTRQSSFVGVETPTKGGAGGGRRVASAAAAGVTASGMARTPTKEVYRYTPY